jgi:7-cyano-7-deazaguanine synthase
MSIILISGGLDSAVSTKWALDNTKGPHIPLSFYYGQRHAKEQQCATALLSQFGLPPATEINLAASFAIIGGSSLTSGLVHGNPSIEQVERTESDLPPTFVPGRNLIMLSIAASIGYVNKVYEICGGWNAVDYSGYPDCRPEFFRSLTNTLNHALGLPNVETYYIHTPLIAMSKAEIIESGLRRKVPFHLTWSCYSGGDTPCGDCDSCKIRAAGFASLNIPDPAL